MENTSLTNDVHPRWTNNRPYEEGPEASSGGQHESRQPFTRPSSLALSKSSHLQGGDDPDLASDSSRGSSTEDSSTASAPSAGLVAGSGFPSSFSNAPTGTTPSFVMNVNSPSFKPSSSFISGNSGAGGVSSAPASISPSNLSPQQSSSSSLMTMPGPDRSALELFHDNGADRSYQSRQKRQQHTHTYLDSSSSSTFTSTGIADPDIASTRTTTTSNTHIPSNETIEAAIQAAIAGSSSEAGRGSPAVSVTPSSPSGSASGSGYGSERGEGGRQRGRNREGRESGSGKSKFSGGEGIAPGRERGAGGVGGFGDARSVPPRDTRTLLFVGNLPYRVRWQDLKDLFRRAGTVLRADVSLGPDNRSRGYGTVLLATAEDAGRAIDMFNGYEWQTRVLEVRVDRVGGIGSGVMGTGTAPGGIGMAGPGGGMGIPMNMSMGGYDPSSAMGMSVNAPSMGYPGGSMYHTPIPNANQQQFASGIGHGQQQQRSQPQLQSQHGFSNQDQQYSYYQGSGQSSGMQGVGGGATGAAAAPPGRTLFVGNLPYHIQWQDLKDLFRKVPSNHPIMEARGLNLGTGVQGEDQSHFMQTQGSEFGYDLHHLPPSLLTFNVLRADVALGPDGRSKGFGTVVLSTVEEAERARRVFNGYDFNGRQLKVHYDRLTVPGTSASPAPQYPSSTGPSQSLTQQMMNLGLGSVASPQLSLEQPAHPGLSSSFQPLRFSAMLASSSSSPSSSLSPVPSHAKAAPTSLSASVSPRSRPMATVSEELARIKSLPMSEQQKQIERLEQLQRQIQAQQLQKQVHTPQSPSISIKQPNPNRPTHIALPARTFHVEQDPSLSSLDPPESINRSNSSGYEGGISGEGEEFGYGYGYDGSSIARGKRRGSVMDESRPVLQDSDQQWQLWELERQREREREQQLFQLLHGSRRQQHMQERQRQNAFSTSLSSLVGGESGAAGTAGMISSAPVSHAHSPRSTFARTSSAGSVSSSVSSSSESSFGYQHHHPYRHQGEFSADTRSSSAAPIYEGLDNLKQGNDLGMGMMETLWLAERLKMANAPAATDGEGGTSGSVSAAGSTRSLPLGLGVISPPPGVTSRLAVRNWADEDEEKGASVQRKDGTNSRTGSTTSASEGGSGSGFGTSASSSSNMSSTQQLQRRARQAARNQRSGTGSDADISEAEGEEAEEEVPAASSSPSIGSRLVRPGRMANQRGEKSSASGTRAGEKSTTDRQHPGPIVLPPPPPVLPISISPQVARGSSARTQSFSTLLGDGLFKQHLPFASSAGPEGQSDYAQFDYSGVPTVQARPSLYERGEQGGLGHSREVPEVNQQQGRVSQSYPQMAGPHHVAPVTPLGLLAITPSMPPFTLVTGPQARQQRAQQQQASISRRYGSNTPGTLSLPPSQTMFYQAPQSQQQAQPHTPPAYLHPLGSPGSPYALGPHHPLHQQYHHHQHHHQHHYHHSHSYGQHPLAQSFAEGMSPAPPGQPQAASPLGHPVNMVLPMYQMVSPVGPPTGYGLGAMSPGAFWGRPGEIPPMGNPYMNPAVGAPVRLTPGGDPAGENAMGYQVQEPKGYFDQLYMDPTNYGYGYGYGGPGSGETSGSNVTESGERVGSAEGSSSASSVEKEILKDKSGEGSNSEAMQETQSTQLDSDEVDNPGQSDGEVVGGKDVGEEDIMRPAFNYTQTQSALTIAKSESEGGGVHPKIRHSRTDPATLAEVARRRSIDENEGP